MADGSNSGIPAADMIAKWNGSAWSALGSNGAGDGAITDFVYAAVVSGTDLYVGGIFSNAAGIPAADYIARWDGNAWSALGSNGTDDGALDNVVYAIAPSGNTLYVGGNFENAAGIATADFIAQWDGNAWSALGSNGFGEGALLNKLGGVDALEVSGSDLYVGGSFPDAAGIAEADYVAKWDGLAWSALGSNGSGNGALNRDVFDLELSGSVLYVGGWFTNGAGKQTADFIAKWVLGSPYKPDGRIRKGSGAVIGNNVYNTTGSFQTKSGSAAPGNTITFGISIQNDGWASDSFRLIGTGTTNTAYTVRYLRGTTDITAAVVAGTYVTPVLGPGAKYLIKAKVTVMATAASGSSITHLVTISSVNDGTAQDAVQLTAKRR